MSQHFAENGALLVEGYNALEREGKINISNRFLEAFQPEQFNVTGWPTRVTGEAELYRYLDSMHDGRLKWYYDSGMAPTEEEFEIIKALCGDIDAFAHKQYGKGIVVKAPLLCSVNVLRWLKKASNILSQNARRENPTVFELGGGCGVLGAMLHREIFPYISTDITQAFYLEQNHLWNGLFPGEVEECVASLDGLNKKKISRMLHVPYWKLWELKDSELEADIIVANHCLSEMHERSLRFYLQYGKHLMRNSQYKLLIAQHIYNSHLSLEKVFAIFQESGYEMLYHDRWHYVFSLGRNLRRLEINGGFDNFSQEMAKTVKVRLEDMNTYFESCGEKIDTPDEEFIHYLGYQSM